MPSFSFKVNALSLYTKVTKWMEKPTFLCLQQITRTMSIYVFAFYKTTLIVVQGRNGGETGTPEDEVVHPTVKPTLWRRSSKKICMWCRNKYTGIWMFAVISTARPEATSLVPVPLTYVCNIRFLPLWVQRKNYVSLVIVTVQEETTRFRGNFFAIAPKQIAAAVVPL